MKSAAETALLLANDKERFIEEINRKVESLQTELAWHEGLLFSRSVIEQAEREFLPENLPNSLARRDKWLEILRAAPEFATAARACSRRSFPLDTDDQANDRIVNAFVFAYSAFSDDVHQYAGRQGARVLEIAFRAGEGLVGAVACCLMNEIVQRRKLAVEYVLGPEKKD